MTTETIKEGQNQTIVRRVKPDAIDKIISLQPGHPDYPLTEGSFESNYASSNDYQTKYTIAVALIEDGRYTNLRFLHQKFISNGDQVESEAKQLQDKLKLLVTATLVQKGEIKSDSPEAQDAEEQTIQFVDQNEQLKRLRSVLPIHVMGAITNVALYADLTDEQKREKLRSFTTRALLRPYLGDLLVQRPLGNIDFKDLVQIIPEEIFRSRNEVVSNLIKNYFTNQALQLFRDEEEQGFIQLREAINQEPSEVKRQLFEEIYRDFEAAGNLRIPDKFKPSVEGWFGEPSPLPLFRQKYFVHEFMKTRRKLLNGATGATKTVCAYLAMETAIAHESDEETKAVRVTIVGPAKARNTWPREARKVFKEDSMPDVFTIRSAKDFDNPRMVTAEYVYVGSELLSQAWSDSALYERVKIAFGKRETNGVILDESDEFKHKDTQGTKMLIDLMSGMRNDLPIVALTATPISTSLENLDVTMALLYPERFVMPQKYSKGKTTFSIQSLRDPNIAFSLLFGEKLMIQWTMEDLFGDKAPKLGYKRQPTPMLPAQQIIYDWVAGLGLGTLAKIRRLRSTLFNPELIKKNIKERGLTPQPVYDQDEERERLFELHEAYHSWLREKDPQIPSEPFSADWIAKFGERDLILQCFFDESLVDGIESLARKYPAIEKDWQSPRAISGKYLALRDFLEQRIVRTNQGYTSREKIFIVSPYHKRGVTRWIDDTSITEDDLSDNAWSLYEYIRSEWLPGLPQELAINIDGSRGFNFRDRQATLWSEYGDRNLIVVASMDSVNESMNWSIRDNPSTQSIDMVNVLYLGWPYGSDEFEQMNGRFPRPGHTKPIGVLVYESEGTIDQGLFELVRMKNLLTQIALGGVELSKEDQEFFKRSTMAKRILLVEPNAGQAFLQSVVRRLRGAGEMESVTELSKSRDGKSFFELFAEVYFDDGKDEFRIVGNNAELVKNIILRSKPSRVLSVGAGSCLFARKLVQSGSQAEIDNLDINEAILRLAKERYPEIGQIIQGQASNLTLPSESYDCIDCSFMLPWSKLSNSDKPTDNPIELERVKMLTEMNRVLKTGGTAVLSFPDSSFDAETFGTFAKTLESHFGFIVLNPSGMSYATEMQPNRRIGWILTLQKQDHPNLSGIDSANLKLLTDERTTVNKYRKGRDVDKATIVQVDYPIFSSKRFEVYNPITRETLVADSPTLEEDLYQSPRDRVYQIKDILTVTQKERWDLLRRRIERELDRRYEDAEDLLAGMIFRRGYQRLSGWDDTIEKIIHADINRLKRNK